MPVMFIIFPKRNNRNEHETNARRIRDEYETYTIKYDMNVPRKRCGQMSHTFFGERGFYAVFKFGKKENVI